ncbi:MAG: tripartite tricarboxylate transporter substrate binding protein [Burkholderiales bacterium]
MITQDIHVNADDTVGHVKRRGLPARHAVVAGLSMLVLLWFAPMAAAQSWKPSRPVAFISPSSPAGSLDLTARLMQKVWDDSRAIGVPVVVINKPGAGNGIAWNYLNERSDGHAISIGTTNLVSNPVTGAHSMGHRDVTPLALLLEDYFVLVVRADSPLKSMADVRDRLRADAGSVAIGFGPGIGAGGHTAAAVAWKAMGADVRKGRFVPYKSAGDGIVAMLAGEIDMVSGTAVNMPPFLAGGRVRALAVIGPQRLMGVLANVPTMKEQGFDAVFNNWRGVIGAKDMRREHIAFWERALASVNESEAWRRELNRNFWRANFMTGPKLREFLDREAVVFRALLTELGLNK